MTESRIIGANEADLTSMDRKPIAMMNATELATELAVVRERSDKLVAVLTAAAPNIAAIEEERDRAVAERDGLRTEVERLHERLKKRGKNAVRDARAGEHWYELVNTFDPTQIKLLPLPEGKRAFLMGVLDDLVIVEVPKDTSTEAARGFQQFLQAQGLKSAAIVVTAGVQFMKLRRVDDKQARVLDGQLQASEKKDVDQSAEAPPENG